MDPKLSVPERDSALGQIVGGQFQSDFIARKHPDAIAAQPAGEVSQNDAVMFQLNAELAGWKLFENRTGYFDAIFFAHKPPQSGFLQAGSIRNPARLVVSGMVPSGR
jgi:hypothetical protein